MRQVFVMFLLLTGALTGCAKQSDLDASNSKLAAVNASLDAANTNLAAANKTIDDLKTQVTALQAQADQQSARLAVKPRLPISWIIRKAILGPGLVVMMNTAVKEPLQVLATIKNPTLGTTKEVELHLNAVGPTMLGHAQGADIDSRDVVTLSNANYSPIEFTIP